jgi:sterol desaturase/sphingolipid hydroxylase (fatty acid hydroxylase superfamily)
LDWKDYCGSLAIVLGAAVFFHVAERRRPYNPDHRGFDRGYWIDLLAYGVLQSYVLGVVIAELIEFLDNHVIHQFRWNLVSGWPIWGQVVFFLVLHDFVTYCFHRMQHRSPRLWRTHEVHHSTLKVDWLSGVRSHWTESMLLEPFKFFPLIVLGAHPGVALYRATIDSIWGMWIHSNWDVRLGPLSYLFVGPEMHRWHHADEPAAYDKNFGTKFAIWDRMLGTIYLPGRKASRYGIGDPAFPHDSYWRQFFYAFRPFAKPAVSASDPSLSEEGTG